MGEQRCAGQNDVNRHRASKNEKEKLLRDIQDMLDGKGVDASMPPPPKVDQQKKPQEEKKPRKKPVDESRQEFQGFLAIATNYLFSREYPKISLSHAIAQGESYDEMGEDYELAKDIARQMTHRLDKGQDTSLRYIRKRCYARSRESFKY